MDDCTNQSVCTANSVYTACLNHASPQNNLRIFKDEKLLHTEETVSMLGNDHLLPEVLVQASPVSSSSSTPAAVLSSSLLSDDCNIARLQLLATRSGASMDNIQLIRCQPEIIKCMDSLKRSPQDKLSICENNDNPNQNDDNLSNF